MDLDELKLIKKNKLAVENLVFKYLIAIQKLKLKKDKIFITKHLLYSPISGLGKTLNLKNKEKYLLSEPK